MKMPSDLEVKQPETTGANDFDDLFNDLNEPIQPTQAEPEQPAEDAQPPAVEKPKRKPPQTVAASPSRTVEYFEGRLSNATNVYEKEKRFCEAGLKVLALQHQLADAMNALQAAESDVNGGTSDEPDEDEAPSQALQKAATAPELSPPPPTPAVSNDLLSTPTTSLNWDGIKRFGQDRRSVLFGRCPTVGDLVNLRNGDGFDSLTGIGKGLAVEIGQRLDEHLQASGEVAPSQESNGDGDIHPAVKRASEINTGADGCLDDRGAASGKAWQNGYEAHGQGHKLTACPYKHTQGDLADTPNDAGDDWIRGWLSADLLQQYEGKGG